MPPRRWRLGTTLIFASIISTRTPSIVLGNQFSVPRQQSFRRGDRRHLPQRGAPKLFSIGRQSPSLVIVEPETAVTHLFSKDPILLDQICDNSLLMAAHPSSDAEHHK